MIDSVIDDISENAVQNKVIAEELNKKVDKIDYSLDEQDTGLMWIDGKKIYQKTIEINVNFGTNTNIDTELTSVYEVISASGSLRKVAPSNGIAWIIPYCVNSTDYLNIYIVNNVVQLRFAPNYANLGYYFGYLTVRYTKTTND